MKTIPTTADVIVIGGGPAGSTAANLLANYGHDVVLLEQARHPRPVVGESVLPHFWKYADALDATADIERAGFISKAGATGIWGGRIRQLRLADFGYTRPALHVERDEFDEILLRVAERRGARVFEEVGVRQVHLDEGDTGVTCTDRQSGKEVRISAPFIIDASGQAAVIARQLGFRQFDKDLRFMSTWGYYENSDYIAAGGAIEPFKRRRDIRPTTLQLGIGDWGWAWHIVQKELTSVGLVLAPAQAAVFKASGATLEERFANTCSGMPVLSTLLQNARLVPDSVQAIRDFAYHPTTLSGPGWYLTGDAAAFVDPINSAGVITALYGGSAAAAAVNASLRRPERKTYYSEIFSTLLRQRLSLFRVAALPPGRNSYPEDIEPAAKGAQFDSAREQELLYIQTEVMNRSENLAPIHARDRRLNYFASTNYRELTGLIPRKPESGVSPAKPLAMT
ncbi:MAG TPA: tryptophan 7-halogenase [Gemmatimonadaceae bacterium]|nr:tryptophan 7-halogenase [Gemmatimonadaceae bacterium]